MIETYSSIWERRTPWAAGHGILADIILWLEDKALQVERQTDTKINLHLRIPHVMPAEVPVLQIMPPKIQPVFVARWQMLVVQHAVTLAFDFDQHKGMPMAASSIQLINHELRMAEQGLKVYGKGPQLWQEAAMLFGIQDPTPGGMRLR